MSDYYEKVIKNFRKLEGNNEAIRHFFIGTEPDQKEPTNQRIIDVDKAATIASEFIHKLRLSVLTNSKRRWDEKRGGLKFFDFAPLPSPDSLEQPLAYGHPDDPITEFEKRSLD